MAVDPELEELIQKTFDPMLITRSDVESGEVTRENLDEYVKEVYSGIEAIFRSSYDTLDITIEEYRLYVEQLLEERGL